MRALSLLFALSATLLAAPKEIPLPFSHAGVNCKGVLVVPEKAGAKNPAVLLFPDWLGQSSYALSRAREMAALGYVALVVDMYGNGAELKTPEEAKKATGPFYADRTLMEGRAQAALAALLKRPEVDGSKVAAMGFCFGGSTALQLARSGAAIQGVVSLHGGLKTERPAKAETLRARILVLHGGADPVVPSAEVAAFFDEMNAAKAVWRMETYGGAVHSFTKPESGKAYDPDAEKRAMAATKAFFAEILK